MEERPIQPFYFFLLTVLVFTPFSVLGVEVHHDGIMLKTALDVTSGQTLYRDSFSQYGALTVYLQALALFLFGKSLIVLRLLTVFFYALSAAVLAKVWSLFLPRRLVELSFIVWLLFAPFYSRDWIMLPWASVPALCFQSFSLYFLVRSVLPASNIRQSVYPFLAGAFAALSMQCRTPVGVFLFLALLCTYGYVALRTRTRAGFALNAAFRSLLGFLAVNALFLGLLLKNGSLHEWYRQTIEWPRIWAQAGHPGLGKVLASLCVYNSDFFRTTLMGYHYWCSLAVWAALGLTPVLFLAKRWSFRGFVSCQAALVLLIALFEWEFFRTIQPWGLLIPVFVLLAVLYELLEANSPAREFTQHDRDLAFMTASIVSLGSWTQYFPVTCPRHIYWAVSPAIGSFIYIWYRLARRRASYVWVSIGLLLCPLLLSRIWQTNLKLQRTPVRITQVPILAGIRVSAREDADFQRDYRLIHDYQPPSTLLIEGPDALYATFAPHLANALPFYVDWPGVPRTAEDGAKKESFIRRNKPLIHLQDQNFNSLHYIMNEFNYKILGRLGNGQGLLLRPIGQ